MLVRHWLYSKPIKLSTFLVLKLNLENFSVIFHVLDVW